MHYGTLFIEYSEPANMWVCIWLRNKQISSKKEANRKKEIASLC